MTIKDKIVKTDGSGLDTGNWKVDNRLKKDVIRVVHISRMIEEKGIVEFAAVSKVLKDSDRFEFFHFGDYDARLRGSITEQEISNRVPGHKVNFMGFTKDVREVYENCEVLFFPSWREGFSRAVAEAMCCGVVPIVWDVPGCEDAVSSDLDGFVLSKGDINGVAEVLLKLSLKKGLLERLSARANTKAVSKFDFKIINKKIIKNI